jgi:hypothetical protein
MLRLNDENPTTYVASVLKIPVNVTKSNGGINQVYAYTKIMNVIIKINKATASVGAKPIRA